MRIDTLRPKVLLAALIATIIVGVSLDGALRETTPITQREEVALSSTSPWDLSKYGTRRTPVIRTPASIGGGGFQSIPFVSLADDPDAPPMGQLFINERYESRFISSEGVKISFPFSGVPIDLKVIDGEYNFAFRKIFDGDLFRLIYGPSGQLISQQAIKLSNVDFPIFRASAVSNGGLYWVIYDNSRRKNYLIDADNFREGSSMMLELPTFYPPAGGTYEMEPPVFFTGDNNGSFTVIAGSQYLRINDGVIESQRLSECETVIEALFTANGPAVLCRAIEGKSAPYLLNVINRSSIEYLDASDGVPWRLLYTEDDGTFSVRRAKSQSDVLEMFLWDLRNSQQSGLLEFGINNTEGRIPWSQIYYLNGLMDVLLLIDLHHYANAIFAGITDDLVQRISLEMRSLDDLLDQHMGFHSKGFTHDRSPALFAVQTSRLLLLFDRYLEELPNAPPLKNTEDLRELVLNLDGHIEQLAHEGEETVWMKEGTAHLRWPKCSAFYFDGMPVPYNHQNEWAYSLFNAARVRGQPHDSPKLDDQRRIIGFFMERLGKDGGFPEINGWYYWYGHAFEGWSENDERSCNTPRYSGDKGLAWISFRTIDFMSVLSALDFISGLDRRRIRDSAFKTVKRGEVYPFASRSLLALGVVPQIEIPALQRYLRATSPWEISNTPWALTMGFRPFERPPAEVQ